MTSTLSSYLTRLTRPNRPRTKDPTAAEEEERIIAQASRFDALTSLPAWNDVLQHAIDRVNSEIIEATKEPSEEFYMDWPEIQRIHVIRWNAQREIVDSIQALVAETRKERDRLIKEREEELEYAGNR